MKKQKQLSPLLAIRHNCWWCSNEQFLEIRFCTVVDCPLYNLRFGRKLTPENTIDAIKRKCADCVGGDGSVANCEHVNCKLYPYRNGKNPNREGMGGFAYDEHRSPLQNASSIREIENKINLN